VENYVPKVYFYRRLEDPGYRPRIEAFFRLTEDQRTHFPLRKGFRDTAMPPRTQSHAEFLGDLDRPQAERNHFQSVDPNDWPHIADGFGDRLAAVFREPGFRCEASEVGVLTQRQRTEMNEFLTRVLRYL
jgi:hypothetical protein